MSAPPRTPSTLLEAFEGFAGILVLDNGQALVLEPFQREIVTDILLGGFSEVWVTLPESSGKSTLLAAVALFWLLTHPGANILVAASSMGQAEILFRQAADMVARTRGLDQRVRAVEGRLRMYGPQRSILIVKPHDSATSDGVIPDYCVCDEIQAMPDLRLVRTWSGKLGKRDGQMVMISTAGEPTSEYEHALEQMRQTAVESTYEGRHLRAVGATWCLHEWRAEPGDDRSDAEALQLVNPASWVTAAELERKLTAPHLDPKHFDRVVRNVATRPRESVIPDEVWDAAACERTIPAGEPIIVGIDYAQARDAFAVVPLHTAAGTPWLLDAAAVLVPERQGVPIPRSEMQDLLLWIDGRNPIEAVALDPGSIGSWLGEWILTQLGIDVTLAWRSQADAQAATGAFLDALYNGEIQHTGDPVLREHALNAVARWDRNDRFLFARPRDSRTAVIQAGRRIDALVAASLAVYLAKLVPAAPMPFIELL